jgi:protein tyrosine/serine phosphatase
VLYLKFIYKQNGKDGIKMKKNSIIISGDAESVNFREIRMGGIAPNTLYRSSHPIKENKQDRIISLLVAQARIAAVLNLSDTNSEITRKAIFAPWYNKLLKNGRVLALGMDFSFSSENFTKKLKKALQFITISEGPWLIHCHAGVDRTGFVSMVLESFMGAKLDDIINDYLISFNSTYESSIYSEVNKEESLVAMQLIFAMGNYLPVNDQNLQVIAENYLRSAIKLTVGEIGLLKDKLAKNTRTMIIV